MQRGPHVSFITHIEMAAIKPAIYYMFSTNQSLVLARLSLNSQAQLADHTHTCRKCAKMVFYHEKGLTESTRIGGTEEPSYHVSIHETCFSCSHKTLPGTVFHTVVTVMIATFLHDRNLIQNPSSHGWPQMQSY